MHILLSQAGYDVVPKTTEQASYLDRVAKQEVESRRFRLSDKMTPGLGYDDRLTVRLGLSKNTIKKYVAIGRLQAASLDGLIIVSEPSIRRFISGVPCIDFLPGLTGRINTQQLAFVEQAHFPERSVRLAAEEELCRRAFEIVGEAPELADEARFVVQKELQRRSALVYITR